ncbi:MAG: NTP transferase domain-containing protein [Flavobacteriales bacterium]|nr:NTP transferase domain-containing protein [Flavobacteriales bacterium]MDG2246150.1 NTP transferase domain-containing protein [Flavobacteriales bacterium]
MKHLKHAKIERPNVEHYARIDLGVFGASCPAIADFCSEIAAALPASNVVYVDTDHASFDNPAFSNQPSTHFTATNVQTETTTSLHGAKMDWKYTPSKINYDLALVNSNHFEARRYMLYYSEKKHASVLKRKAYLANCLAVVLAEGSELPADLEKMLPEGCPVYSYDHRMEATTHVTPLLSEPKLKGLVLAGGRSSRMGKDKTKFNIHGKPQFEHIADLMAPHCSELFVSQSSVHQVTTDLPTLDDAFSSLGPFGAILTAFKTDPNAAWLVMASDLPYANADALGQLVTSRSTKDLATAFYNEDTDFPDPLFTIWEPKAYPRLLEFLAMGYSCPRKALINSPIHMITPKDAKVLFNMNTPADLAKVKGENLS